MRKHCVKYRLMLMTMGIYEKEITNYGDANYYHTE